ncbi:NAD-dependent epimerase/dehydratase family protein [Thermodesulfobacteriota bacterium]
MIKWITTNIGTASYEDVHDHQGLLIIDVRDMIDREGNDLNVIRDKIQEIILQLNSGNKVVICCDYGISRSNAIAAAVLSKTEKISLNNAVRKVISKTGQADINIDFLSEVRDALHNRNTLSQMQEASKDKIVLLTGSSGKIGTSLLPKLINHTKVFTPNRSEMNLLKGNIETDFFVKENRIDTIIHLANPRIYTLNSAMGETIVMLKNILDVCCENNIHLVYISSWTVYSGYRADSLLASENLPQIPKGTYGETKYLCEKLISNYVQSNSLKLTILRSSPVYGTGDQPKFILNFYEKAKSNNAIVAHKYKNGYPMLDLIHIDDLIDAVLKSILKQKSGTFNIGFGKGVSTTEVAKIIINLTKSKSKIKYRKIQEFSPNIVMDISKAKKELDWNPQINIEYGLIKYFNQFMGENL